MKKLLEKLKDHRVKTVLLALALGLAAAFQVPQGPWAASQSEDIVEMCKEVLAEADQDAPVVEPDAGVSE